MNPSEAKHTAAPTKHNARANIVALLFIFPPDLEKANGRPGLAFVEAILAPALAFRNWRPALPDSLEEIDAKWPTKTD